MRSLPYWIQRADFSATEHEAVELADGVRAFETHDWRQELDLLAELESAGSECCPPGIGFVDPDGSILHVCPTTDGRAMVHYHFAARHSILGLIPVGRPTVRTKQGVHRSDVADLIGFFFEKRQDWLLEKLAQA